MKEKEKQALKPSGDKPSINGGGGLSYSVKALSTAVGGGLLSLAVASTQMWYADHLESRRRQADHGYEFQRTLLDLSGRIEHELLLEWQLLSSGQHEDASRRFNQRLEPLWEQWRLARLLLRNRGTQIYGDGVGYRIYNSADLRFVLDRCGLVVRYGEPGAGTACLRRRDARIGQLERYIRLVRDSGHLLFFDANKSIIPISFHANAENARALVIQVTTCLDGAAAAADAGVECAQEKRLLGQHVTLVRFSRDNLADAIAARSSLGD